MPVQVRDALAGKHGEYEMVLTNPPFGKKSSVTIVNEAGEEDRQSLVVHRDDFWASTSNKQLNFLQHVFTILKQHGRPTILFLVIVGPLSAVVGLVIKQAISMSDHVMPCLQQRFGSANSAAVLGIVECRAPQSC